MRQRPVHSLAHDVGQDQSRGTNQRTGDDEHVVAEHKSSGASCQTRVRIEQSDDHRHVCATDWHSKHHTENRGHSDEQPIGPEARGVHYHECSQSQGCQEQGCVDYLLQNIAFGLPVKRSLKLGPGYHAAGEGGGTDDTTCRSGHIKLGWWYIGKITWGEQSSGGHQGRSAAAKAVESRDHLGHGGHLYGEGQVGAYGSAYH